jgi:hypothetical protein
MWVYTVFIQGISTTLTGQLSNFHVFKKVHTVLESEFYIFFSSKLTRMKMLSLKFR